MKCEGILAAPDTGQRECGEPATYSAYSPPIYLCKDCLHELMQDASPEEQESVREL